MQHSTQYCWQAWSAVHDVQNSLAYQREATCAAPDRCVVYPVRHSPWPGGCPVARMAGLRRNCGGGGGGVTNHNMQSRAARGCVGSLVEQAQAQACVNHAAELACRHRRSHQPGDLYGGRTGAGAQPPCPPAESAAPSGWRCGPAWPAWTPWEQEAVERNAPLE